MSEYLCTKCFNIFQAESDEPDAVCPRCGYYASKSANQTISELEAENKLLSEALDEAQSKIETGDCGKYDVYAAIRHLEANVKPEQQQALKVLVWHYYQANELAGLLSDTLKSLKTT